MVHNPGCGLTIHPKPFDFTDFFVAYSSQADPATQAGQKVSNETRIEIETEEFLIAKTSL
jgi:hypothetical protein